MKRDDPYPILESTRRYFEARIARASEFRDDRPMRTAMPRVGEEGPVVRRCVVVGRRR